MCSSLWSLQFHRFAALNIPTSKFNPKVALLFHIFFNSAPCVKQVLPSVCGLIASCDESRGENENNHKFWDVRITCQRCLDCAFPPNLQATVPTGDHNYNCVRKSNAPLLGFSFFHFFWAIKFPFSKCPHLGLVKSLEILLAYWLFSFSFYILV